MSMGASLYHEFYQRQVGSPDAPAAQMAEDQFLKAIESVIAGEDVEVVIDSLIQGPSAAPPPETGRS